MPHFPPCAQVLCVYSIVEETDPDDEEVTLRLPLLQLKAQEPMPPGRYNFELLGVNPTVETEVYSRWEFRSVCVKKRIVKDDEKDADGTVLVTLGLLR